MSLLILSFYAVLQVGHGSHGDNGGNSSNTTGANGNSDQTSVTSSLNGMIATKPGTLYGGGKGVIIRNINDGVTGKTVVPGSLIVNDIFAASVVYPNGNPMCPSLGWDGYHKGNPCDSDPFLNAVVAIVVGSSMDKLFKDFGNIQNSDWGWGVFYGTDSNSVDKRCNWIDKDNGWECPGAWVDVSGKARPDSRQRGSGVYPAGNPLAGGGGGGAGCHSNGMGKGIDQFDSTSQPNLVRNYWCECNYDLRGNGWQDWVEQWIKHGKAKADFSWMKWFGGGGGKAPNWAVDEGICWVNNPRDMIYMQNMIWFHRWDWSNELMPQSYWNIQLPETQRYYWGWNEIPLNAVDVNNPLNWDAIVIKLPVAICGGNGGVDVIDCMPVQAKEDLENQLDWHVKNAKLKVGQNYIGQRPGSYVVLLREWQQAPNYWQRWFFCQNWVGNRYKFVFNPQNGGFPGECYVDHGGHKPMPPAKCNGAPGAFMVNRDKSKCLDIAGGKIVNGAEVQIWDCNGLPNQHFIWCGDNRIVSATNTDMCLDIPGGVPGYATYLQMWECNGRESQKWGYDSKTWSIFPTQEGEKMCVDLDSGRTQAGTRVNLFNCQVGTGEAWALVSPPPPPGCNGNLGHFKPKRDMSKCLDVPGGQLYNGAQVQIWDCNGLKQQSWMWCADNRIVSGLNDNFCLDVPGDSSKATYLQMWECNGHENQRWGYNGNTLDVYPTHVGETMCMDLASASLKAGTKVNLYPCQAGGGESWVLGSQAGAAPPNATSNMPLFVV